MTHRSSISRLADDAPVPHPELNDVTPTSAEMAAVRFVKEMAAHVDQKHGRLPTRETQKKVASVVREKFFDPEPAANSWPSRKPPFVAYGECPDCGATKAETSVLGFFCEHERCPILAQTLCAGDAAYAAIQAQAARTARRVIKDRARAYALRPRDLDAIADDLSRLSPSRLVSDIELIITHQRYASSQYRWFGFGGEVQALNLRGAMLYARYARAKARQLARRAL